MGDRPDPREAASQAPKLLTSALAVAKCLLPPLHWYLCILFGWPQHSLLEEGYFFCMHILIRFKGGRKGYESFQHFVLYHGICRLRGKMSFWSSQREFVKDWAAQEKKSFAGRISIRAVTEVTDGRFDDISALKAEAAL